MIRRPFSMIELILALGVVAIGVASITALFPVGLSASRDGMAEVQAANSAEQALHLFQYRIRGTTDGWKTYVYDKDEEIPDPVGGVWNSYIPDGKPSDLLLGYTDDPTPHNLMSVSGAGESGSEGTIHQKKYGSTKVPGVYMIVRFREKATTMADPASEFNPPDNGSIASPGDDEVDFRAIMAVWQEASEILPADVGTDNHRDIGATIKVEVSWPAEIPYLRRKKAVYQLELFNR